MVVISVKRRNVYFRNINYNPFYEAFFINDSIVWKCEIELIILNIMIFNNIIYNLEENEILDNINYYVDTLKDICSEDKYLDHDIDNIIFYRNKIISYLIKYPWIRKYAWFKHSLNYLKGYDLVYPFLYLWYYDLIKYE